MVEEDEEEEVDESYFVTDENGNHVRSVRARSAKNFNNFSSSSFYCVTQITRISLVSLTYTARTPLENQRSDVNSIMTKT